MHDRVDAAQRRIDRRGIAHVGYDQLGALDRFCRAFAVHVGPQGIEHAHRVAARDQRAQNMAADEAGAAGEQDAHGQAPSRRRRCSGRAGWPRSATASRRKVAAILQAARSPATGLPDTLETPPRRQR